MCCEGQCSKIHSVLRAVNEFLLVLATFSIRLGTNSVEGTECLDMKAFRSCEFSEKWQSKSRTILKGASVITFMGVSQNSATF